MCVNLNENETCRNKHAHARVWWRKWAFSVPPTRICILGTRAKYRKTRDSKIQKKKKTLCAVNRSTWKKWKSFARVVRRCSSSGRGKLFKPVWPAVSRNNIIIVRATRDNAPDDRMYLETGEAIMCVYPTCGLIAEDNAHRPLQYAFCDMRLWAVMRSVVEIDILTSRGVILVHDAIGENLPIEYSCTLLLQV